MLISVQFQVKRSSCKFWAKTNCFKLKCYKLMINTDNSLMREWKCTVGMFAPQSGAVQVFVKLKDRQTQGQWSPDTETWTWKLSAVSNVLAVVCKVCQKKIFFNTANSAVWMLIKFLILRKRSWSNSKSCLMSSAHLLSARWRFQIKQSKCIPLS